jgi:hypothetical protein
MPTSSDSFETPHDQWLEYSDFVSDMTTQHQLPGYPRTAPEVNFGDCSNKVNGRQLPETGQKR